MPRLLVLFLATFLTGTAAAQTFKIATILPDGTRWMEALREGARQVSEQTADRVQFRFYPGGTMGNDQSVLRKIRIGQLQGGALTGGGLSRIDPNAQVYGLPFLFDSYQQVDRVRRQIDPILLEGLEQNGFVSFGLTEAGFAYLMSDAPIRTVSQLQQQKVWIPEGDAISRTALQALDVAPVILPLTDVLAGLQTGLVDTVATSPIGAIALQWHTRVKYLVDEPLMYLYGTMVIDKRAFDRLSAADRRITREVLGRVFAELNAENRSANREARSALEASGIEFVVPERNGAWERAAERATAALADKGAFDRGLLQRVQHLVRQQADDGG